jgi:G:T-mismatch repair DNA endonuclease (very short patch repair protein)
VLGSRKGHGVSEATRQKIRDKLKGRKISEEARRKRIGRKLSPEHRRNIGLASKGKKHSEKTKRKMRGRKLSEDAKRKLSEARKGKKNPMYGKRLSEEHRRKIGRKGKLNKNYGKHLPEETKRKLSLALKGKKYAPGRIPGMKGKKHSEATKRKISSGLKGHITTEKTRRKIGAKTKISTKRFWENMTEGQKEKWKEKFSPTWYKKGQVSPMKGKKITSSKHKRRMSVSAKHRFQTQKHPMEGKRHDEATRKLILEARLKQKPTKNTVPEKLMRKMLKDLGIRFEEQIGIKEPACQPDFFIQPNILIFSDGDYIHANPNPFLLPRSSKIHPGYKDDAKYFRNKTMKDKRRQDQRITRGLKKEGYKVLRFWQSELENNREKCLQEIIEAIKESKRI